MQHFQDRHKPSDRGETFNLLAINGVIILTLIALAWSVPSAPEWISAAAQAEFVDGTVPADAPTQIAEPTDQMRMSRAD
jgi:hypothetical protein